MIAAIIQARIGSARLPGKSLALIEGVPLLAHIVERVRRSHVLDQVVVATTDKPADDSIASVAKDLGVGVFRGDEKDVLDRYYKAAKAAGADTVVRVTGDCPLHDPAVIDEVIAHFRETRVDYCCGPTNYPEGLDTEVFSFAALERAWREARLPSEREHVTLYIRNHPVLFNTAARWTRGERDYSAMHWSVDSEADLSFVRSVYAALYPADPMFGKDAVLALLARQPELLEINRGATGWEGLEKSLEEDKQYKKEHP